MRKMVWLVSVVAWLVLFCAPTSAKDALKAEWIKADIANIDRLLPQLSRTEVYTLKEFEKVFGWEAWDQTEIGFGARTFKFSSPGGYTSLRVTGVEVNDKIASFRIAVGNGSSWAKIRTTIIDAWRRNSELAFEEGTHGIKYDRDYSSVIDDYKSQVGSQLGSMKSVSVPLQLKDAYEYLTSLGNNSVFGSRGCTYSGSLPVGKTSIDQLVAAQRIDLIENILKGYNPGGRVYALIALQKFEQSGVPLGPETQNAMRVITGLEIEIDTCSGCLLQYKTAGAIIKDEKRLALE